MNLPALAWSVGSCMGVASLGGLLTGRGGMAWFRSLNAPRMQVPFWFFFVVAVIVYIMYGIALYRLIALDIPRGPRTICLTAVGVTMIASELWNYLFFGLRSVVAGFAACTAFLPLFIVLETALFLFEPVSAWVLLPYGLYFTFYDLPWGWQLWKLNPHPGGPATRP